MVIHIKHLTAECQKRIYSFPVLIKADIQNCRLHRLYSWNLSHKGNVTLNSSNQVGLGRLRQSQLYQGANSIGIAVKHIVHIHISSRFSR